jgi:hypothetical protein
MEKIISIEDKLLAKLPPAEMAARLMTYPARQRLDLILERADAEAVVAAVPEQDFYLCVKELGEQSAAPLLALARTEQLNHLLDIECWHRDELVAGRALAQLEEIAVASGEKFMAWLYRADFELLVLLFKKWLDVELLADEDDYHQASDTGTSRQTLDDQYYFTIRYPDYEELIKTILGFLFENHRDFYLELMNHVCNAQDSEVEELAYQFHRGRLEDNAIPDYSEARSIYRPLPPERLAAFLRSGWRAMEGEPIPPTFALALVEEQSLFAAAMAAVTEPALRRTIQIELAALANKIVIADELAPAEAESLRQAAAKAGAYVNLGLEMAGGPETDRATGALRSFHLEDLFRLAHGKIDLVHGRIAALKKTGWLARWPHGFNFLDHEWLEAAGLLLARTPLIRRSAENTHRTSGEDFIRTGKDLRIAEDLAAVLEAVAPLFAALEGEWQADWDRLDSLLWRQGQTNSLRTATLGTFVLTAAARLLAGDKWQYSPLPVAAWPEIFSQLSPRKLEAALQEHLRPLFVQEENFARAVEYFDPVLARYRTETGSFGTGQLPDPKLVPFFLFTARRQRLI